jgi:enoyl-CoA hydratase/carnithine racemase
MELTHWKLDVDADHLAWLRFDRAGSDTNTFSSEALRELGRIADHLATMPPKGLAILSAKDNGFAAGADIEEFTKLKDADEAIALTVLGNEVFDKIAALSFPTVAMIHGFCMGGGMELALACKYRVMDDGPKTRMALPEVMLGIVPGWGGAKRLPALIGAAPALDLMLTGRGVDGRRAKKLGLVDAVTPRRHFENAARQILTNPPPRAHPKLTAAMTDWPGIRNLVAKMSAKKVAERARRDHYPAPYAIIELWRDFGGDVRNVPREHPASTASLFFHPTTRNLIRIFKLQERLKSFGKSPSPLGEGQGEGHARMRALGAAFWGVAAAGATLTLARFSEAFLILRAQDLHLELALAPLVLVTMNVVYAAVAYPAGKLADRVSPRLLLVAGIACLVAADVVLALATGLAAVAAGVVLWGLHMGLTQGLLSAMVAHAAPADLRGTAFGVFNLVSGVAMLAASALAGALWQYVGPAATFWAGAALAAASFGITRFATRA